MVYFVIEFDFCGFVVIVYVVNIVSFVFVYIILRSLEDVIFNIIIVWVVVEKCKFVLNNIGEVVIFDLGGFSVDLEISSYWL